MDRAKHFIRDSMIDTAAPKGLDLAVVLGGDADHERLLHALLRAHCRRVLVVEHADAAVRCLQGDCPPDLLLAPVCEDGLPSCETLDVLAALRLRSSRTAVVVWPERPDADEAIQFLRAGAYDYMTRSPEPAAMETLVRRVCHDRAVQRAEREECFSPHCPAGVPLVGRSDAMEQALELLRLVAESHCETILICGETGTGKELAARAVHAWRCGEETEDRPFLAVNCATLNGNLLESELFGHVKGAFTGADRDKIGLFEAAREGVLFLDEISEMPLDLQAKLLRVLQERTFRPVGGTRSVACRATIIASSNRDLLADAKAHRFRPDLYYRLAVFPITLPALRSEQRRSDIILLGRYFLQTCPLAARKGVVALSPDAERVLLRHEWPGNVRELRNAIDRAIILERGPEITPRSLRLESSTPPQDDSATSPRTVLAGGSDLSLKAAERELIVRALRETNWHRTRAAALLGITRATLHAKLKRYEIASPDGISDDDASFDPECDDLASALAE